ncbi:BRO-N domain-containing protein [Gloeothece verrucosa]|uniref:Prophage antirepressor n=1 Tax=Gloeothece verrucosa (strain PCC 7822) TaxID=497965 RepID=E0UD17_GLOV7|nr:BRO family protein [Gloeothece verrucosa]ADN16482.1 prophage antirepressor [Gloeothece verrucosa PCC 7822]
MSNLTIIFTFEEQQVRFVGTTDNPEWVAQDVCDVLGIESARDALQDFDPDEKGIAAIPTSGGLRSMLTVTEAGLYRLIFRSNKPVAKKFQRWIFHEVIPSIRRTGSYSVPGANTEVETIGLAERVERLELEQAKTKEMLSIILQSITTVHNKEIIIDKPDEKTVDLILHQLEKLNKSTQGKLVPNQQELPRKLALIIQLSKRLGAVRARDVKQYIWSCKTDDSSLIREWFGDLEKMGKGKVSGSGNKLAFTAY